MSYLGGGRVVPVAAHSRGNWVYDMYLVWGFDHLGGEEALLPSYGA